jgi:2-aminoadipate transaminase
MLRPMSPIPTARALRSASPAAPSPPAAPAERIGSSVIRDLLALTEQPGIISLAGGQPAPDTFPVDEVRAAVDAVLTREGATALQYSATEGVRPLREWIAVRHGVEVDQVTVTSGSQQGLDLVARALVAPGDTVVCADPGYVRALQAFRLADAALVGIPSDSCGLRVDVLEERLAGGLRPRFVYVIPELSNPTGATLSAERRTALATLADHYDFWLVTDDPYSALRWRGATPPALTTHSDRVVSLGTVSKVLCPGLRVGYVVAPEAATALMVRVKQAADLHTSTLTQLAVHELATRPGFLDRHLAALPGRYRERAEALTIGLRHHLGDRLAFEEPDGGMFVWARLLPDDLRSTGTGPARAPIDPAPALSPAVQAARQLDTARLLKFALDAGVAFVPGSAFSVGQAHDDRLRISFATPSPAEITEAVRRLATAIETSTGERSVPDSWCRTPYKFEKI